MKVDGSLRSLLQGVSQQPRRDRLPGQCEEQINMSADPVTGLARRPPTDMVANIGSIANQPNVQWKELETRDGLRWLIQFYRNNGGVRICDLNGVPAPVTITEPARVYLENFSKLSFTSIRERTYITNRAKIVEMMPNVYPYWNRGNATGGVTAAVIQVLGAAYSRSMQILLNGNIVVSVGFPNGSEEAHSQAMDTSTVAARIVSGLRTPQSGAQNFIYITSTGAMANTTEWTILYVGSTILIINNLGNTFDMQGQDGFNGQNLKVMVNQVTNVADLPKMAAKGYVVRVATKADPDMDSYYTFEIEGQPGAPNGSGFGQTGFWREAVAPNTPYMLNAQTMPIAMDYDPDAGSFALKLGEWDARTSGTAVSNPNPSFVGATINDLGQFQGRLVAVASNYVIMSRTNFHEDWWIKSVENQADTDPIDISSNADNTGAMEYIVPHNKDLVVFSTNGQFIIYGRNALTPANAALMLSTSFQADLSARPMPAGRNIFFGTNYGRYTNMREFYTEGGTEINDTRPITQHVKEYIAGRPRNIVSSSNYEIMMVLAETDPKRVYTYQYIWSDTEKVQSAWSYWQYDFEIDYAFMAEQNIYLVVRDELSTSYYLMRQSLDVFDPEGVGYPIYLDARFDVLDMDRQFILPAAIFYDRQDQLVLIQGAGCPNPGMPAEVQTIQNVSGQRIVTLKHSMNGGDLVGGIKFKSRYVPNPPLIKDEDGIVISTGRLRIKHFLCTVEDTGYFRFGAESKYYPTAWIDFEGRVLNSAENVIGQEALYSGTLAMPFRDQTDHSLVAFESDTHLPFTLLDIEWVGQYLKRGKRVNIGGG